MRLITERDVIRKAVKGFRNIWGDGTYPDDKRGIAVGAELAKLDPETATASHVNELIGNTSWTGIVCDECGNTVKAVVEVGEEPDYESSTARLCFTCIGKAVSMCNT